MSNGVIPEAVGWGISANYNYTELPQYLPPLDTFKTGGAKIGSLSVVKVNPITHTKAGVSAEASLIYDNLWLLPDSFNFGIITKSANYPVYVWNTQADTVTLTDLSYENYGNCDLLTGTIPQDLTPTAEASYSLTVAKYGVPVINGTINLTFTTDTLIISLKGTRLLAIPATCEVNDLNISYTFLNSKSTTAKQREERRNLVDTVKRKIQFSIVTDNPTDKAWIDNAIRYGQENYFGIPIQVEPLQHTNTDNLQGIQTIHIKENTTKLYNINKADFLGIYNRETKVFEIGALESVAANEITVGAPIIGDFPAKDTILFPVILCYLEDYNSSILTAKASKHNFTFKEA